MVILRAAMASDIQALWELITQATYGMTTLMIDRDQLTERLERSQFAFTRQTIKPAGEPYVFVMEDVIAGKIVGTSCIFSKVGGYEPFYSYKLTNTQVHCDYLDVTRQFESLHLQKLHDGPSELGSLFLLPEYRGQGRGRLLSLSRFAFIAQHPKRFSQEVIAEMRGMVDDEGRSPFWDAIARPFFQMEFPHATSLMAVSKRFIEDLMPQYPIYLCLLPETAREVIGRVHPQTEPALAMLKAEGFEYRNFVDIFDAGPVIHCNRDSIHAVQRTKNWPLAHVPSQCTGPEVIAASTSGGFRSLVTRVDFREDGLAIPELAAVLLQVRKGETVWTLPLKPDDTRLNKAPTATIETSA